MLKRAVSARWLAGAALIAGIVSITAATPLEPNLVSGLRWRMVGPFRGGRVAAVTGVIGQPGTFYIGMPLGGVWKTTSAGTVWYPVMDGVKEASSVGSVQVAPSDPNIVYAGMGDLITGGGINEGNGMYKSVDAGKTWEHLGLDETKQIPSILVDPKDPNLVIIAAQGNVHKHMDTRGVFRSTDGGKHWTKTLYVDDETGGQEIAWAFDSPKVMLATTVQHYSDPLAVRGGGPGGGGAQQPTRTKLFKSIDEGLTWKEIVGNGLPAMTNRTSIAIAMNTNSQRMFIIGNFGLYRSDDGGGSWRQMAAHDTRIRNGQNGYNCGVYIDPSNPDVMYTINTSSFKSVDGGNTFTGFKGAPGGDDPQQMWIDPTNGKRMLLGVDQGATISLDGGLTWSSWYNQPMEQVYHISTDNSFPYWIYATQQDAGAIATRSRGDLGTVNWMDWKPVPGYEFGYIVADPLNPKIVYSGGPARGIVKISYPSQQWIDISPNMDTSLALRQVGNQPLAFGATNPHELFVGFQYLMSTTDGGVHWKKLSPDLGYPKGVTPPPRSAARAGRGGGAGGRGGPAPGGSIESFSTSSVAPGVIWVGTNNGLVKVTKDHGVTWTDVTIPDLPNPTRADISTIDASHHDAAEAYVAIDYHTVGDYAPYFYRTKDYGKTWTKIVNGFAVDQPSGSFGRVIRADTKKAGLLFAGTESSMYVSFNDGDDWQSLMLNLPNTSYRDIQIKDNDLVVGTYGRSFWILDDISPLRQMTAAIASEPVHFFKPGDAWRVRRDVNGDTPFPPEVPHGENPPPGAILYYWLASKPSGEITLEVSDAAGHVIRHMSSAPVAPITDSMQTIPEFWKEVMRPMPAESGTNRINWDMRYDNPPTFSHSYGQMMGAVPFETPWSPEGPLAPPGVYRLKLTVDGKSYTQTVTLKNDPRSPASAADIAAQHVLLTKLYDGSKEAWAGYEQVTAMRSAVGELAGSNPQAAVESAIKEFEAKLVSAGGNGGAGGRGFGGGGRGGAGGPPPAPNFAGLVGALNRQLDGLDAGDLAPTESMMRASRWACADLRTAVSNWKAVNGAELAAFNKVLTANGAHALAAATPSLAAPVCATEAAKH
ncbi:MAG: WD40/YVTN/BNR-like repeat-containing protein [Gemmatimonadaceae bacterium]